MRTFIFGLICMVIILLLMTLSTGCIGAFKLGEVDPKLKIYVQDFEETFDISVNLDISIEELPDDHMGVCKTSKNTFNGIIAKFIIIDKDFFENNKHNYHAIQQPMYHELAHCVAGLEHDNRYKNGRPKSIMNFFTFGNTSNYKDNLEYYIEELRSKMK